MQTIIKQRNKYLKLFSLVVCLIVLLGFIVPKSALSEKTIAATKSLGITSGSISITLRNKTVLKLKVLPDTLEMDVRITLSEPDEIQYREDIIGIFSVKMENNNNIRLKKPINIKVFPGNRIDPEREKMIQVYKLKKQDEVRKYWSRVFDFSIDNAEQSINVLMKEPGIYKIEYTKLKVGSIDKTNGAFFKLNSPNGKDKSANFSLKFNNTGYVFFLIEAENGKNIWNGYSELKSVSSDWNNFVINAEHFSNDSIGKYKVSCYNQLDIFHLNELWSAWFIRDHGSIGGEGEISDLLDTYAPYVFYGNHNKSQEASKNPWDYGDEFKDGEIYFPIDIRDLVTYFAPNFYTVESNEFINGFNVSVGKKTKVMGKLDYEHTLKDKNIIEETSSVGINFALFNDVSLEYGLTRKWKLFLTEYDLVEFEGMEDEPYMAGINSSTSYPDKKTSYFSISKSKIYGTAYEHKGKNEKGTDQEYIFLQYFFYYPFDPKNGDDWLGISEFISRHAGDRERFVVILEKNGSNIIDSTPIGAYFFHHLEDQQFYYYGDDLEGEEKFSWNLNKENCPGAYVDWSNIEKTNNHSHIYIAQGSHAIYFRKGSYIVDVPNTGLSKDLKEYAGGQEEKIYSTKNGNLVYLPRLSQIDTVEENTEFSFLLFSGPVAETSREERVDYLRGKDLKIYFPPYDYVWYAVHKYCFNDDNGEFEPKNNVSDDLAKLEGTVSIEHTLTPPSKITVSRGGILGSFTVKESNNGSSYYAFYVQPYVTKPDGNTVNFNKISTSLAAGESSTHYHYLSIPSWSELGTFTFGAKLTDTDGNLIDNDSFEFTVSSSTAYASKRSARRLEMLMRNPETQVVEEEGWKVVIVPERNR